MKDTVLNGHCPFCRASVQIAHDAVGFSQCACGALLAIAAVEDEADVFGAMAEKLTGMRWVDIPHGMVESMRGNVSSWSCPEGAEPILNPDFFLRLYASRLCSKRANP